MPIAFGCPHCQRELRAFDHLVGRVLTCPGCRKPFNVPALGEGNPPATFVETVYLGPRLTVLPPQQPAVAPTPATEPAPLEPTPFEATPDLAALGAAGAVTGSPSQLAAPPPMELQPAAANMSATPDLASVEAEAPPPPPPEAGAEFEMSDALSLEATPPSTSVEPSAASASGEEVPLTDDMLVPEETSSSGASVESAFEQSFELTEDSSATSGSASGEDMQLMEDIVREEGDQSALG